MANIGNAVLELIFLYILPAVGTSIRWCVFYCLGRTRTFANLWKDSKTNLFIGFILFFLLCFIVMMHLN